MKQVLRLTFLTTLAILVVADAADVFAQARPNRNPPKQERMQQKLQQRQQRMQQGDIPPALRKQFPSPKQRPGGAIPGLEAPNANKALNPQQREMRRQLIESLGLTPEQKFRIGGIYEAHKGEAIEVGRRLRQARKNLDQALWNENYNENLVKQYTEELAQAQADQIRLQFRVNSEIRGTINPEQIRRFRQKEREMEMLRRQQIQQELQLRNPDDDQLPPIKKPPNEFDEDQLLLLLLR